MLDKLYIDQKYNFCIAGTGEYIHLGCIYKGTTEIIGEKFLRVVTLDTLQERLLNPKYIWGIGLINLVKGNYDEDDILVSGDDDEGYQCN